MFVTLIGEKRARLIAAEISKGYEEHLPELVRFHENGMEEPRAIECVQELNSKVNRSGSPVQCAFEDSNRLREYFLSHIPTVEALEAIQYYGEAAIKEFWSQFK